MFDRMRCAGLFSETKKNVSFFRLALGLTEPEMHHVFAALSRRDFYKVMITH